MGFYKSFTFIIAFMVLLVFMQMTLGDKAVNKFLWLVLLSMIIFNVDTFKNITKGLNAPDYRTGGGGDSNGAGATRSF